MKYVLVNGSPVGWRTRVLLDRFEEALHHEIDAEDTVEILDLKNLDVQFSDGRNYLDYDGDTLTLTKTIMDADVLVFASPTFQASIPGTLKNVFDLLPQGAFLNKTSAILATAGSDKHYLVMEQHLKPILHYMKANVLANSVFALDLDFVDGMLVNEDVRMRLGRLAHDLKVLSKTYKNILDEMEDAYDF